MANFAQLDENNIVTRVIVINNSDILVGGVESEEAGIRFCQLLLGKDTKWKQTSYNSNFRKQFAGIGYKYDEVKDIFISLKPFPSWSLDNNGDWIAPVACPNEEGKLYAWNEAILNWEIIVIRE